MGLMQITIPEDLQEAFEKAVPGETIEQAVQRLLRAEILRNQQSPAPRSASLVQQFRELAASFGPVSNDEIRRAREAGRP